jgi:hypothetical protein
MSSRGLSRLRQFKPVPASSGADALMSRAMGCFVVEAKLSGAGRSGNSMSMNLQHAAALLLVGWYLMMPPLANAWDSAAHKAEEDYWATCGYLYGVCGMPGPPRHPEMQLIRVSTNMSTATFLDTHNKEVVEVDLKTGKEISRHRPAN